MTNWFSWQAQKKRHIARCPYGKYSMSKPMYIIFLFLSCIYGVEYAHIVST